MISAIKKVLNRLKDRAARAAERLKEFVSDPRVWAVVFMVSTVALAALNYRYRTSYKACSEVCSGILNKDLTPKVLVIYNTCPSSPIYPPVPHQEPETPKDGERSVAS